MADLNHQFQDVRSKTTLLGLVFTILIVMMIIKRYVCENVIKKLLIASYYIISIDIS